MSTNPTTTPATNPAAAKADSPRPDRGNVLDRTALCLSAGLLLGGQRPQIGVCDHGQGHEWML